MRTGREVLTIMFSHDFRLNWRALLLALLISILFATVTMAHADLTRSEPEDGARLAQRPEQVTAWFSQELDTGFSTLQVFDRAGQQVDNGDGGVDLFDADHASMVVSLPGSLPPGSYVVRWTATSAEDGDATEGEFTFRVGAGEADAGQASTATTPVAGDARWPTSLIATGVGVLLLAIIGLVLYPRLTRGR